MSADEVEIAAESGEPMAGQVQRLFAFQSVSARTYYISLALAFGAAFFATYLQFFINGKALIWSWDGIVQHYPNIVYFRKWFADAISAVLNGQEIPLWDLSIGLGQDFLNSVAFRPLSFLALLFPQDQLELFFWVRHTLSLLFGVCAFSVLIKTLTGRYTIAGIIGSLCFVFCGISMAYLTRHAIFAELLFYLPLFLLGIERFLKDATPYLLVVVTALCGASYFYNLFTVCITGVIYAVIRLKSYYAGEGSLFGFGLKSFMRCSGWILLGMGIASFSLLPNLFLALSSGRSGAMTPAFLYDLKYYYRLLLSPISSEQFGTYGYIGVPSVALIAVLALFSVRNRREIGQLRIALIVMLATQCLPLFAKLMNGFAGMTNRYSLALGLVAGITVAVVLPVLMSGSYIKCNVKLSVLIALILLYVGFIEVARIFSNDGRFVRVGCLVICAALLFYRTNTKQSLLGLLVLVVSIVEIGIQAYCFFSPSCGGIVSEYIDAGTAADVVDLSSARLLRQTEYDDASVTRCEVITDSEAKTRDSNYGLRSQINGISTYFSYAPKSVVEGSQVLGNSQTHAAFRIFDFDQRSVLNAISAVKYSAVEDGVSPKQAYGSIFTGYRDGVSIYRNNSALPLMYSYSGAVDPRDFSALDEHEKEWAMLQGAVWDEEVTSNPIHPTFSQVEIVTYDDLKREIAQENSSGNNSIRLIDGGVKVSAPCKITFEVSVPQRCELYAIFDQMEFVPTGGSTTATVYVESGDASDRLTLLGEGNQYATSARNILSNVGYSDVSRSTFSIRFSTPGIYQFSDFTVAYQPMDEFDEFISNINRGTEIQVNGNTVSGEIESRGFEYVCLAIPYSEGWTATVDGQEVDIHRVNEMYMGVEVGPGNHVIEFKYHTVLLAEGTAVSAISVLLAVGVALRRSRLCIKDKSKKKGYANAKTD